MGAGVEKDWAQVCGQVLSFLEEADGLEFMVGVLRSYVDFRETIRDERTSFGIGPRSSTGGCCSPTGSRKAVSSWRRTPRRYPRSSAG